MQRFKLFIEANVGDKCSCCTGTIDENGKCGCGSDCEHCGGQHDVTGQDQQTEARRKGAPKMTGDSIAIQRAKDAEHNKAMGRTKTGRKKPVRTMTSTQRSLAQLRGEEVELDEATMSRVGKELEAYARKNGGIDKNDFMKAATMMKKGQTAQLKKFVDDLDTEPREKILSLMDKDSDRRKEYKAYQKSKRNEEVELDEAVKITHVLIDTADGNKVKAMASSEKGVMQSKNSAERPPMSVKDKNTLKIVQLKKPVGQKASEKMVGRPLKEEVELDENVIAAQYINENNISMEELENMTEEELNELIGKAIGGAFKMGAKAAVGAARVAKKGANRVSASGRADAAEKKAATQEKKNKDRARIKAAQDRLRAAKAASRNK